MAYLHLSHSKRWLNDTGINAPRWHVWDGIPLRCIWCGHLRSPDTPYTPPQPTPSEPEKEK